MKESMIEWTQMKELKDDLTYLLTSQERLRVPIDEQIFSPDKFAQDSEIFIKREYK